MSRIFTIGHSNHTLEELVALLRENAIELVVDVRRFPTSRRHPHFTQGPLSQALEKIGIGYRHEPDLGGHRQPRAESLNRAWRNPGFQGFADHMQTPAFRQAFMRLVERASGPTTAILCAEALPGRCHRQLIADALVTRGVETLHVLGPRAVQPHRLHPDARVLDDGDLIYPDPTDSQANLFPE